MARPDIAELKERGRKYLTDESLWKKKTVDKDVTIFECTGFSPFFSCL